MIEALIFEPDCTYDDMVSISAYATELQSVFGRDTMIARAVSPLPRFGERTGTGTGAGTGLGQAKVDGRQAFASATA